MTVSSNVVPNDEGGSGDQDDVESGIGHNDADIDAARVPGVYDTNSNYIIIF